MLVDTMMRTGQRSIQRILLIVFTITIGIIGVVMSIFQEPNANAQSGVTYYVDAVQGDDTNSGTDPTQPWQNITKVNTTTFQPGDTILFKRGSSFSGTRLVINESGTDTSPITIGAWGNPSDAPPELSAVTAQNANFLTFQDLLVEHGKANSDAFAIRVGHNITLKNMEVRNGTLDGVNAIDADGIVIDSLHIHHFLAGSFTNQADAHGITLYDTQGATIRNTEIHHVSGDSFQTDPDRDTDYPQDILIENSHFWTSPLTEDFNANWLAGQRPGENAIDTKVAQTGWETAPRMRITLRNITAHGWVRDGFIPLKAVFNMKEKIEATFDGVTVYDSEIAFRLRQNLGGAQPTIRNAVIYDVETALYAENGLAFLKVQNSTFGDNIGTQLAIAGGTPPVDQWIFQNNAWFGTKPSQVPDATNLVVSAADFVNSAARDYHVAVGSALIDAGVAIPEVPTDREDTSRSIGIAPDIGAYEFVDTSTPNTPPGITVTPDQTQFTVKQGETLTVIIEGRDQDGDDVTVTIADLQNVLPGAVLE